MSCGPVYKKGSWKHSKKFMFISGGLILSAIFKAKNNRAYQIGGAGQTWTWVCQKFYDAFSFTLMKTCRDKVYNFKLVLHGHTLKNKGADR